MELQDFSFLIDENISNSLIELSQRLKIRKRILKNYSVSPMNIESLQQYCLSKKATEEALPFGPETLVFKVGGKLFLLAALDAVPLQFNVKCEPEKALQWREQYACVRPGYHMNKTHWNTIIVDGTVSDKLLKQWIDESYDLVVGSLSKKAQQQIAESN